VAAGKGRWASEVSGSRYPAAAVSGRYVPDRLRRLRLAERQRHRGWAAGNDPRLPARWPRRRAGVLDAALAAVSGDLRLVFPPRAAADRPMAGPQPLRR